MNLIFYCEKYDELISCGFTDKVNYWILSPEFSSFMKNNSITIDDFLLLNDVIFVGML